MSTQSPPRSQTEHVASEGCAIATSEGARQLARDAFEAIMLRTIDDDAAASFGRQIEADGSALPFLRMLLTSQEFSTNRLSFKQTYFPDDGIDLVPAGSRGSPYFDCRHLGLALRRDTPLGRVGETLTMRNDQMMLPAVLYHGAWAKEDLDFLRARTDPAKRYQLLDIGANVGLFSRQVMTAFPNIVECHCLEPDPENFAALTNNLSLSRFKQIVFHKLALGSLNGRLKFFRDEENSGNYSLLADAMRDRPFHAIEVEVREAGQWFSEHIEAGGLPIIWKSDTQGNDEAIIAATPWSVWKRVEYAIIELWRIKKDHGVPAGFFERIGDIPNRQLNGRNVSVDDVASYLASEDYVGTDLLLWRKVDR